MATLLHIDCSARNDGSITRQLSAHFVETWKSANPGATILRRDLAVDRPNPYVPEMMIPSFKSRDEFSAEDTQAMAESDLYIDELIEADVIVAGVPMYNFMVPSTFKAWIDQVVMGPRAFTFDKDNFDGSLVGEKGFQGLLLGKKMMVMTSRGCDYRLPQNKRFDLMEDYMRVVFEYIGITDMTFINAQAMVFSPPGVADQALVEYKKQVSDLAEGAFSDLATA